MNILVLAAASQDEYKNSGSVYPKNLFEIREKPILQHVIESLSCLKQIGGKFIFMIPNHENNIYHTGTVIKLLDQEANIIPVLNNTAGALCTALLAIDHINNNDSLIVINGDIIIDDDKSKIVKSFSERSLDAGIITFESVHPRWSYAVIDSGGYVIEAAEKKPISTHALTGFYWFSSGRRFVEAAEISIKKKNSLNGVYYISPMLNEMILQNAKIGAYKIDKKNYHSLKQPTGAIAWDQYQSNLREG